MEPNETGAMQSPENSPKKASPFADSPYEMPWAAAQPAQPQGEAPQPEQEPPACDTPQPEQEAPACEEPQPETAAPQAEPAAQGQRVVLPPIPPREKSRAGKVWKGILAAVLVIALGAAGCAITAGSLNRNYRAQSDRTQQALSQLNQQIADLQQQLEDSADSAGDSVSGTPNTPTTAESDGLTPAQIYAQYQSSVVAIANQSTTNVFGEVTETASSGSGFILSEDGYIVTNYHVVEDATTLTVITSDGAEYAAELVGYESANDIAVIKIDASGLKAAVIGSSDALIVGDQVVAIGNPLGELTNTLTVGYISATDRDITIDGTTIHMLQTDAAINPGNSGGPLFNMKGEVIGITSAKYSGTTDSGASIEGIGFAIPMDDVIDMIQEILDKGYVSSPYMGISVMDSSEGIGAYVVSVESGGAAEAAGVKPGDMIIALGEYEVDSLADLTQALKNFSVGETTTITVYRSRQILELTITFADKALSSASTSPVPADETDMPLDGTAEEWYRYWLTHFGANG